MNSCTRGREREEKSWSCLAKFLSRLSFSHTSGEGDDGPMVKWFGTGEVWNVGVSRESRMREWGRERERERGAKSIRSSVWLWHAVCVCVSLCANVVTASIHEITRRVINYNQYGWKGTVRLFCTRDDDKKRGRGGDHQMFLLDSVIFNKILRELCERERERERGQILDGYLSVNDRDKCIIGDAYYRAIQDTHRVGEDETIGREYN